jgi:hypothetical protein
MLLWIFQIFLNLFFGAAILYAFRTRKRVLELERLFADLEKQKIKVTSPEPIVLPEPVVLGQVVEKATMNVEKGLGVAERYEKAELLMAKGHKIQYVASETGLSLSELRLLEKISTKSH